MIKKLLLIVFTILLFALPLANKSFADSISCPSFYGGASDTNCPVCPPNFYYANGLDGAGCYPVTADSGNYTNLCSGVIDCTKTSLPNSHCVFGGDSPNDRQSTGQNGCCVGSNCVQSESGSGPTTFTCQACPAGTAWNGTTCYDSSNVTYTGPVDVSCTNPPYDTCDKTNYTGCWKGDQPSPRSTPGSCLTCPAGSDVTTYQGETGCFQSNADGTYTKVTPTKSEDCSTGFVCLNGQGCKALGSSNPYDVAGPTPICAGSVDARGNCPNINSAFGFTIPTDSSGFIKTLLGIILSISGGIALILIIRSGYQLMLSQGNPEKMQTAREELTAAIVGLLFIIFSLVVLQVIGVDILRLPGLQ